MLLPTLVVAISLGAGSAAAEEPELNLSQPYVSSMTDPQVGGVLAPAALPPGAMSLYAMLGAPELGAGFRQGLSRSELEVKLMVNYLLASAWLEAGLRVPIYKKGKIQLAPAVAVGLEANSGTRYYDPANFPYVAVRPRVAFITSIHFTDTVAGVVQVELPWSISLTNRGSHVAPMVGAGAEVHLGGNLSGLLMGNLGFDTLKQPNGPSVRPAWAIRLGLGFRLF